MKFVRKIWLLGFLLVAALSTSLVAGLVSPTEANAQASGEVEVDGRGFGHGRGLGQYGALGYARQGWTSDQILDHYYSNTSSATIGSSSAIDPSAVRVNLAFAADRPTTVELGSGSLSLRTNSGAAIATVSTGAVRLIANGNGTTEIQTSASCSGPWTTLRQVSQAEVNVHKVSNASGTDGLLEVCGASRSVWVEGSVRSTRSSAGAARTVNVVDIEHYLEGVVPNESPASWDFAALEAQAVAARSYVIAGDTRFQPYADTCDTAQCQVYDGVYTTRNGFRQATHSRTDQAIETTRRIIRVFDNGRVARTEFSASTGGYTVNGDFPAVKDDGDAIAGNPFNTWTETVSLSTLDKYGLGRATGVEVVERNGLGADGGRVLRANYIFPSRSLSVTGDQVRVDFGFRSNWFSFSEAGDGIDRSEDAFVTEAFETFTGSKPTSSQLATWRDVALNDGRLAVARRLVRDDHFSGELIDDLYRKTLRRSADRSGRAYWVDQLGDGTGLDEIGQYFYSLEEYFIRADRSNSEFVANLYRDVLSREADSSGQRYWTDLLNRSVVSRHEMVFFFTQGIETRTKRAERILNSVVGKGNFTRGDLNEYAQRLTEVDDIAIAAEIAADLL